MGMALLANALHFDEDGYHVRWDDPGWPDSEIAASNFDDFPEVALKIPVTAGETGQPYKDWVFINYTFKWLEGLAQ